jgi:formylglycine-generating enzyme required for sulfatase activity
LIGLAALVSTLAAPAASAVPSALACDATPPGMSCIPAGSFTMGRDDGPKNERPAHSVWLQTYFFDTHEVTFAAYQVCAKAGACKPKRPIYSDFNRPKQPMVAVDWYDAVAYCRWAGKHLPSEAQWEKAARGPDGDLYPWGNQPATCERAIIQDQRGRSCGVPKAGAARLADVGRTFEVGARGPYRYGHYDVVGNSWEWVADWFAGDYMLCGASCTGVEPKGPCGDKPGGLDHCAGRKEKVLRGGSWYWDASYATGSYRRPYVPENEPVSHFGFRCAASVEEAKALAKRGAR